MLFKIATWNVNSIRVRLPQILDWIDKEQPDILTLQETKTPDEHFPKAEIEATGYHVVYSGEKTYNGVATLSKKTPKEKITDFPNLDDPARRILGLTFDDLRILNVYVPNGSSIDSDKYIYKLNWLKSLNDYLTKQLITYSKLIILGDFNIAPADQDVYDPKAWEGQILVSEPERNALKTLLKTGLVDAFRLFDHDPKNAYSWWDYRFGAFRRNMGLRLDLILISQPLVDYCRSCEIDKSPRKLKQPSDHTPVVATFDL